MLHVPAAALEYQQPAAVALDNVQPGGITTLRGLGFTTAHSVYFISFPDGTALLKEIVSHGRGSYTTGADVGFATESKQWLLMVKDASGRFESDPMWGNGWGWALFLAEDPTKNAATDFQKDSENFMREGVLTMAVLQQTVTIGRWGVRAAINHLEGRPVPQTMFTPLLLVTKDSLDSVDMSTVREPSGWTPPT